MLMKAVSRLQWKPAVAKATVLRDYSTNQTSLYGKFGKTIHSVGQFVQPMEKMKKVMIFIKNNRGKVGISTIGTGYLLYTRDIPEMVDYTKTQYEKWQRRNRIGVDVAQGLAWSHYIGYLQYVLKDLDEAITGSEWYRKLSKDEKKRVPFKLYQLLPRSGFVDIPMKPVDYIYCKSEMRNGNIRQMKIPVYEITDGEKKYFCLCECPATLETIKHMKDLDESGLCKKLKDGFTSDAVLVQLMRYYHAMYAILSKFGFSEKAKLLPFSGNKEDLRSTLLETIREDLHEGIWQSRSNLQEKLLYPAEKRGSEYSYSVYVTFSDGKQRNKDDIQKCEQALQKADISCLSEETCLGSSWEERLQYAATQCRFIVFIQPEKANKDRLISTNVEPTLSPIIANRKVQSIVVVRDKSNAKVHIPESLRWVSCLAFDDKEEYANTLADLINGKVNDDNIFKTYFNIDHLLYGWAWGYTANYLNKILPGALNELSVNYQHATQSKLEVLYLVFPLSGRTFPRLEDENKITVNKEKSSNFDLKGRKYNLTTYQLEKPVKYFAGQYVSPVSYLSDLKEVLNLTDEQIPSKVQALKITIELIMKSCLRSKEKYCRFIEFDDLKTNGKLKKSLSEVLHEKVEI